MLTCFTKSICYWRRRNSQRWINRMIKLIEDRMILTSDYILNHASIHQWQTMIVIRGREVAETYRRRRNARTSLCVWKVLGKFKSNTEIPRVFKSMSSGKKCPHILCICINFTVSMQNSDFVFSSLNSIACDKSSS